MKNSITRVCLCMFVCICALALPGCVNYRKVTKNKTTTTTIKPCEKNKKLTVKTIVIFEEDIVETDDSFTLGSKGLGTYSIVRDLSFM